MTCKSCTSENQLKFAAEINIHIPGLRNLDKPTVWVFPKLLVCTDCGFAEFAIPETELRLLGKDAGAHGIATSQTRERSVDLSRAVAGLPLSSGEIATGECAADKLFSLKNSFYRN